MVVVTYMDEHGKEQTIELDYLSMADAFGVDVREFIKAEVIK
ncbi:hypothetical protein [Paenibacillus dendritiformis]